ncbi:MAG: cytochrome c biogenesis protein [Thiomicrorhabdus sp.]|nr:MAG: cytochrome c biogenesis protein [Thiomicrorhabdus sp.]
MTDKNEVTSQDTDQNQPSQQTKSLKQAKKPSQFMNFLGSMNLAVTLLMMLSIASVVGTVLKQDQAPQDYIVQFGPFWADVFNSLGLFHVYGALWFVFVLVFLLLSTSVCVVRNTPTFWQDMKQFSEKLSSNALKHQPNNTTFETTVDLEKQQNYATALLQHKGYKTKVHQRDDGSVTVAGLKGKWNRIGYFFTHVSIIIICLGALLDSNLLLKYREMTGNLEPETRAVSLKEIGEKSKLGADNTSFRGSVSVPEGGSTDILFLPYEDGFLVQQLPFTIVNKNFRVEFYDTGMPKSFESDLVLTAPDLDEPIEATIAVNHPLYYKNYAIYQSSFGDGGTKLKLKVHPLKANIINPLELHTAVNSVEPLKTPDGKFKVEFNDFKMHNIIPASEKQLAETGRKMHNNGPTIIFKVRNEQGKAWEYENYMAPSLQEGRLFFMTGVRTLNSEPFKYMFIPADADKTKTRFFTLLARINDPEAFVKLFSELYPKAEGVSDAKYKIQTDLFKQLLTLFRARGFEGISEFIKTNVPAKEQDQVSEYYFGQTSFALQILYLDVLKAEGLIESYDQDIPDFDKMWFDDALRALTSLSKYGPPMYFEIENFVQIQSTGLQITKSPGKDIVYFGSAMLIIGVFFLFYVRQRRVWIHIKPTKESESDQVSSKSEVTMAAKDNRNLPETKNEFDGLVDQVKEFNDKNAEL